VVIEEYKQITSVTPFVSVYELSRVALDIIRLSKFIDHLRLRHPGLNTEIVNFLARQGNYEENQQITEDNFPSHIYNYKACGGEQAVAADASRTSPSHAGCSQPTIIVVRQSLNQLLCVM
jgi:hypothetical protein